MQSETSPTPHELAGVTAARDSRNSMDQADAIPVSYRIVIEPLHNQKLVRVVFTIASPPQMAGLEAFHFTLPHEEAGIFARKMEIARKKIR